MRCRLAKFFQNRQVTGNALLYPFSCIINEECLSKISIYNAKNIPVLRLLSILNNGETDRLIMKISKCLDSQKSYSYGVFFFFFLVAPLHQIWMESH